MTHNKQFLHPKSQAGQALVLLAGMMLALLGVVGLAIDTGAAYYNDTRSEIAASAAAMAGVVYMPDQFTPAQASPAGSKHDAQDQVLATAAQNGFTNGVGGVTVSSAVVAGHPNQLSVTVTKTFNTFFMVIFGTRTTKVSRTAIAVYQPPLSLGQSGTQMGTIVSQLGSGGSNYYFMRTEGWSTNRVEGDAFTPNPSGGSAGSSSDVHAISGQAGTDTGAGVAGLPSRGGYNYTITIPAGGGYIQVYNAINGPDDGSGRGYNNCENHITASNGSNKLNQCNTHGSSYYLHEEDGIDFNNKTTFATMEYTVLAVSNPFVRSSDTLVSQVKVSPIDATGYDGSVSGCSSNCKVSRAYTNVNTNNQIDQTYNSSGNPTNMLTYHSWVTITGVSYTGSNDGSTFTRGAHPSSDLLAAGTYRLRVDSLSYNGSNPPGSAQAHKGYDVRVLDKNGNVPASGVGYAVSAWSDMEMYTPVSSASGGHFDMQALQISPDYAGSTVIFDIYDIGDMGGSGNIDVSLIDPTTGNPAVVSAPAVVKVWDDGATRTNSGAVIASTQTATVRVTTGGNNLYDGHWIRFVLPISPTYAPGSNPANWWWSIRYQTSQQVTSDDTVTFAASLKGNPVHLIIS